MTAPSSKDAVPKQNAALTGAARAFSKGNKPPVKPKPNLNTYNGNNGALAAAKIASPARNASLSRPEHPGGAQRLIHQRSGSSIGSENDWEHQAFLQRRMGTGNGHLQPPGTRDASKSPSFIAATLAASRSVPASPQHTGQQQLSPAVLLGQSNYRRRSSSSVRSVSSSRASSDHALDTTPIPPTNSLIGMFERNAGVEQALKKRASTKPARKLSPQKAPILIYPRTPSPKLVKRQEPEILSPEPVRAQSYLSKPPDIGLHEPVPLPRRSSPPITKAKPIPIPPKPKPKPKLTHVENDNDDASSDDSFVSASDYQPSIHALYKRRNSHPRTLSVSSSPNFRQRDVDALADAIVASSLASSRAASPTKHNHSSTLHPPPPPPSRRHLFSNSKDASRTPSPAKTGMRTTMRKPPKPEEEDDAEKRRGRKNIMKKHPNKHHEGDRKRWRDEITPRERKRYEAVWASNKGLFPSTPDSDLSVCSLVARDIFSRSRLHTDVLEEAYSLVDRKGNGRLEREEFVVALWLIDQRLKGRKLPIRVSESVWQSVGILGVIKIKIKKKH